MCTVMLPPGEGGQPAHQQVWHEHTHRSALLNGNSYEERGVLGTDALVETLCSQTVRKPVILVWTPEIGTPFTPCKIGREHSSLDLV